MATTDRQSAQHSQHEPKKSPHPLDGCADVFLGEGTRDFSTSFTGHSIIWPGFSPPHPLPPFTARISVHLDGTRSEKWKIYLPSQSSWNEVVDALGGQRKLRGSLVVWKLNKINSQTIPIVGINWGAGNILYMDASQLSLFLASSLAMRKSVSADKYPFALDKLHN